MTPGDHGAIKLLLDAKVPAAVNGMLATAKSQESWNQGGGRAILLPYLKRREQIVANTITTLIPIIPYIVLSGRKSFQSCLIIFFVV